MKLPFLSLLISSCMSSCVFLQPTLANEQLTTGEKDRPLAEPQSAASYNVNVIDYFTEFGTQKAQFGSSVSLSSDGNTVAIGATSYIPDGRGFGGTFIFKSSNSTETPWLQVGEPIVGDAETSKNIGGKTSISGDGSVVAVVLHGSYSSSSAEKQTTVRIYGIDNASNSVSQIGESLSSKCTIDPDSKWKDAGEEFACLLGEKDIILDKGLALSSNGKTVATASVKTRHDSPYHAIIHIRAYNYKDGEWIQVGKDIEQLYPGYFDYTKGTDFVTLSLSHDGKSLAIGQSFRSSSNCNVYSMDDGGNWVKLGGEILPADVDYIRFPIVSLSQNGKTLAVSGYDTEKSSGYPSIKSIVETRVFSLSDTGTWDQVGEAISSLASQTRYPRNGAPGYVSMELSGDGKSLALGFPEFNKNGYNNESGRFSMLQLDEASQKWIEVIDKVSDEYDFGGSSVSVSGDGNKLAAGVPRHNGGGKFNTYGGKVEIYDLLTEATHSSTQVDSKDINSGFNKLRGSKGSMNE